MFFKTKEKTNNKKSNQERKKASKRERNKLRKQEKAAAQEEFSILNEMKKMIKINNKETVKEQKELSAPKSAQSEIKYNRLFEDGICEIEEGVYSKAIVFDDINYQIARRDEQINIFSRYCEFLNYFDPDVHLQINITNRYIDRDDFRAKMLLDTTKNDGLDDYRKEYNQMLSEKAMQGQNSIVSFL